MAKGNREKIKLESTAGTGHFYTTTKNKRTSTARWKFPSLTLLLASMLSTKKRSSSNRYL